MDRRISLKLMAGFASAGLIGMRQTARAQTPKAMAPRTMATVVKEAGVIGLVPLDVKVTSQAVQRARDAGIVVITQEGPNQDG